MSDPQPLPGHRKPERAEPLQPDSPARGDETAAQDDDQRDAPRQPQMPDRAADPASTTEAQDARQKEQSEQASKNVREGYD